MKRIFLAIIFSLTLFAGCTKITQINNLQTEYQVNPLGIDVAQPRFSWQMQSEEYGARQTAYRVVVAVSQDDLNDGHYLFDTDKVESDISVGIEYKGATLAPQTRYFWKVMVWNEKN